MQFLLSIQCMLSITQKAKYFFVYSFCKRETFSDISLLNRFLINHLLVARICFCFVFFFFAFLKANNSFCTGYLFSTFCFKLKILNFSFKIHFQNFTFFIVILSSVQKMTRRGGVTRKRGLIFTTNIHVNLLKVYFAILLIMQLRIFTFFI